MIKLTLSLQIFLLKFHRDLIVPLTFGHAELFTNEIQTEYLQWCKTEEGKQYLKGGAKYKEILEK